MEEQNKKYYNNPTFKERSETNEKYHNKYKQKRRKSYNYNDSNADKNRQKDRMDELTAKYESIRKIPKKILVSGGSPGLGK